MHHRAGDDSRATALLAIKAFQHANINSVADFSEKFRINIGQLYDGGYDPSRVNRGYRPNKKIQISRVPYSKNPTSI